MGAANFWRTRRGIGVVELAMFLISFVAAILIEHEFERTYVSVCVGLAVECGLHMAFFMFLYAPLFEDIHRNITDDGGFLRWSKQLEGEIGRLSQLIASSQKDIVLIKESIDREIRRYAKISIPVRVFSSPPSDWPFSVLANQVTKKFADDCKDISDKKHIISMDEIPEISLQVPERITVGAFCTALEENIGIFLTDRGRELLRKQRDAAMRLSNEHDKPTGFTRLFIFSDLSRVDHPHIEIMRDDSVGHIAVRVISRTEALNVFREHRLHESHLDFAKWTPDLLMEIRSDVRGDVNASTLYVSKQRSDIEATDRVIESLMNRSKSFSAFIEDFITSRNLPAWHSQPEQPLALEAPDGPHEEDCKEMLSVAATIQSGSTDRVALYGLTKPLMSELALADRDIDVIDARFYRDHKNFPRLNFIQDNWLKYRTDKPYDIIIGDDILCNLTRWQIPLIANALANNIRPGGIFITRATAIYSPGLLPPPLDDTISRLRSFDPRDPSHQSDRKLSMLSPGVVYEAAWPTLHTGRFYDPASGVLDMGEWNRMISARSDMTYELKNALKFGRDLKLTSIEYAELKNAFVPKFKVVDERKAYSPWARDAALARVEFARSIYESFEQHYKIIAFERLSD